MDFNKLRTFITVAEHRSFSKAAMTLGRTQSAISQAIKQFESDLGFALLDRKKGKVYVTPEGEALCRSGKGVLQLLEDKVLGLRNDLGALTGCVRVGAVVDHGWNILAERLASFQNRFPKISIEVLSGKSNQIERRLIDNELDVGIIVNFKHKDFFEIFPFAEEEEILVGAPVYLKKLKAIRDFSDVLNAALIDMSPDLECFRPWFAKNAPPLLPRLARRGPAILVESHHAMREIVRSGYGIAMLPRHLAEEDINKGHLRQLLKGSKPTRVGVDLAIRKKRSPRLLDSLFVQHLLNRLPEVSLSTSRRG